MGMNKDGNVTIFTVIVTYCHSHGHLLSYMYHVFFNYVIKVEYVISGQRYPARLALALPPSPFHHLPTQPTPSH